MNILIKKKEKRSKKERKNNNSKDKILECQPLRSQVFCLCCKEKTTAFFL